MELKELNVVVIGAGIGGLTAGALLARRGASVTVLEAEESPGGCAATFSRNGYRFDAGATVGCGFHPGGPMERLGRELGLDWPVVTEPVAWRYSHRDLHLDLHQQRRNIIERFPRSNSFWAEQAALAKLLWQLSEGGVPWPLQGPRDLAMLGRKGLTALLDTPQLLKFSVKTAHAWLASHGLDTDPDFVRFIDAQLLISVQTTSCHANALSAAIALDLPHSGAWRVRGGMGTIAELLAASIEDNGGAVLFRQSVTRIDSVLRQVVGLETSDGGAFAADAVVANLTADSLALLAGEEIREGVQTPRSSHWSAFMLYLGVDTALFSAPGVRHLQLIGGSGNLGEGNSLFVSISSPDEPGRAPEGQSAVTISTHTRPEPWFEASLQGRGVYMEMKKAFTERVLDTLSEHFPDVRSALRSITAGTPVTWERYTGRYRGLVGGYPQTSLFRVRGPLTRFRNLMLVGDSIFPGQSLPGVVTGARRTIELLRRCKSKA